MAPTSRCRCSPARAHGLFTAPAAPLHRHLPEWFQNFVLFTNYQFYIDEFVRIGHELMNDPNSEYIAFVEPGNVVTRRKVAAGSD